MPNCSPTLFIAVLLHGLGCSQMAEHVEPKAAPSALELEDIAGDWRASCTRDLLLEAAEGQPVYVQMRILIPADGRAESGGIVGTTRFDDESCEGAGIYGARAVSYTLQRTTLWDDVYVLSSTLEDHGPEDPFSATRFIALQAEPESDVMMLDIDGDAGRSPLTEEAEDPQSDWGWFAEDPTGRGIVAVRVESTTASP